MRQQRIASGAVERLGRPRSWFAEPRRLRGFQVLCGGRTLLRGRFVSNTSPLLTTEPSCRPARPFLRCLQKVAPDLRLF